MIRSAFEYELTVITSPLINMKKLSCQEYIDLAFG